MKLDAILEEAPIITEEETKKIFEKLPPDHCGDSANFALKSLNKIDPAHNARWGFIWNNDGPPHHWVTAFIYNKNSTLWISELVKSGQRCKEFMAPTIP